jgi:hypothetical protein
MDILLFAISSPSRKLVEEGQWRICVEFIQLRLCLFRRAVLTLLFRSHAEHLFRDYPKSVRHDSGISVRVQTGMGVRFAPE